MGESDFEIVVAVDEARQVFAPGSSTVEPSPAKPSPGQAIESGRGPAARRRSRFAAKSITLLPADERRFGRYEMICRLASGGMADLFLAALPGPEGFQKLVVIKQVHEHLSQQQEFIQMFVDEARLVASISHPNVVQVMDLGRVGDSYFMVMEYVAGENLSALLRRTRVPFELGARIASSAASGLHAAHELRDSAAELLQVVHRDISPENILLSYEGVVKILDFGVARARSNLRTTEGRVLKGKCGYLSPEQIAGEPVDRRADVFSLGVVLWELTTRHRLFRGATEAESLARILRGLVKRPSDVVLGYPGDLEAIVMKALARDPLQRFQTAEELQLALESFLMQAGSPVVASSLANLMKETFADRIAARRAVLREFEEVF